MRLFSAAIAAAFALGLAGTALAQEEAAPAPAGGASTAGDHAAHHPKGARQGPAPAGGMMGMEQMHAQMHGMHMSGTHSMAGTITSIDHRTGIIHFRTPEGTLRIHFPPSTTRHLKAGNTITVYLGYERGRGTHGGRMGPGMSGQEEMHHGQMGQGMGGQGEMQGGQMEHGMGGQGGMSGGGGSSH